MSDMGRMSVNKGKRYERKIAKILSEWSSIELVRTPDGAPEDLYGDIWPRNTTDYFPFCVECKHVEGWSFDQIMSGTGLFYDWLYQAEMQATGAREALRRPYTAATIFTKNRFPDFIVLNVYPSWGIGELLLQRSYPVVWLTSDIGTGVASDIRMITQLDHFIGTIAYQKLMTTLEWVLEGN